MKDKIKIALKNLLRKKSRTILTILSITIGVSSVVIISSVGAVGKSAFNSELSSIGVDGLLLSTLSNEEEGSLNKNDLDNLSRFKEISEAVPMIFDYINSIAKNASMEIVVWGVDNNAPKAIALELKHGKFISGGDVSGGRNKCVVDENYAKTMFYRTNVVGKKISLCLNGIFEDFEITGVVTSGSMVMKSLIGEYIPSFVYIPYTTMQQYYSTDRLDQIAIKIKSVDDSEAVSGRIVKRMNIINKGVKEFKTENLAKQKENLNNLLSIVSIALSSIASISLIVSGLGIVTVMLASVSERTREIGIKKAIGANSNTIMLEFLTEAAVISFLGAIVGSVFGLLITFLGCILFKLNFTADFKMIFSCIGICVIMGITFGVYPAYKASKYKPVDALRFE